MMPMLSASTWAVLQPIGIGLALAVVLLPLCRVLALQTGVVAHPRNDRWHRQTVPMLGGVGIALATLIGALITGVASAIVVPVTAAFLIFVVGLVDDVLTLKPATKLIAQITLAALLVYFGYQLTWVESRLMNSVLTIVWVVGLTNAFNLLDNMDGLLAGVARGRHHHVAGRLADRRHAQRGREPDYVAGAVARRGGGIPVLQLSAGVDLHGRQRQPVSRLQPWRR